MICDREQLLRILDDIRTRIESGDSLEGSIQYLMSDVTAGFEVTASYRIGNLEGQGGIRLIQ